MWVRKLFSFRDTNIENIRNNTYNENKIHKKKNGDIQRWQFKNEKKTSLVSIERNQIKIFFHLNVCTQSLQYEKRSIVNPLKHEFMGFMGFDWLFFQIRVRDSVNRPKSSVGKHCIMISHYSPIVLFVAIHLMILCVIYSCRWDTFLPLTLSSITTATSRTFIVLRVLILSNSDWCYLKAHNLPFIHAKFHSTGLSSLAST